MRSTWHEHWTFPFEGIERGRNGSYMTGVLRLREMWMIRKNGCLNSLTSTSLFAIEWECCHRPPPTLKVRRLVFAAMDEVDEFSIQLDDEFVIQEIGFSLACAMLIPPVEIWAVECWLLLRERKSTKVEKI